MPIGPGERLQHYHLVEKIGEGGMGVVWKAVDTTLDREVAVKILPEAVAGDREHLARFSREARLLASLNHPNIVTLFAVDRAADVHFLVMEYVPGQTLDQLIPPGGLSRDRFFELALPLLEAVSAAHERNITHRDLKPRNVMVGEDSRVRVLDFGLARLAAEEPVPPTDGGATLTTGATIPGAILGTWAYMSPEQAEGGAVDGRSDLFSLGVLLYEMATGRRPFEGNSPAQLVSAILRDTPPPPSALRADLPRDLDRVVLGCLEKHRERRPPTARGLLEELRRIREHGTPGGTSAEPGRSIAVLPFANLSADPVDEYFSDGMSEEIINALARIDGLRVAARTSAFEFKGRAADVGEIARRLNVATVLEGSVRRAGNRLRITARLVDVASGGQVWSERFDRDLDDVFAVQDEIATAIAGKFENAPARDAASPLVHAGTRDFAAYEEYLQGRFFVNKRTEADLSRAIALFEQAIARDARYAEPWAGLADALLMMPFYSLATTGEYYPRSREAARRALALNPRLGGVHASLAYTLMNYGWEWEEADREFREAIALSPGDATAHKWYTDLLMMTGRREEALRQVRLALELDPLSPNVLTILGQWHRAVGQEEESMAHYRKALSLDPTAPLALEMAARQFWLAGDDEQYFAHRERLEAVSHRIATPTSELRKAHAAGGRNAVLRAQLAAPSARRLPSDRARWHAELGEMDAAFEDLEQAFVERDVRLPYITYFADFAPIRNDPRYAGFLARMGLR